MRSCLTRREVGSGVFGERDGGLSNKPAIMSRNGLDEADRIGEAATIGEAANPNHSSLQLSAIDSAYLYTSSYWTSRWHGPKFRTRLWCSLRQLVTD